MFSYKIIFNELRDISWLSFREVFVNFIILFFTLVFLSALFSCVDYVIISVISSVLRLFYV